MEMRLRNQRRKKKKKKKKKKKVMKTLQGQFILI